MKTGEVVVGERYQVLWTCQSSGADEDGEFYGYIDNSDLHSIYIHTDDLGETPDYGDEYLVEVQVTGHSNDRLFYVKALGGTHDGATIPAELLQPGFDRAVLQSIDTIDDFLKS